LAKVEKSALVPFSAPAMFELVNDVDNYQVFLPWCRTSRVLSDTEDERCGELEVARAGIRQTFATCNRLHYPERIDLRLKEGPFRRLEGHWQFQPLSDTACKVRLEIEFEFSGKLIDAAFGAVFRQIADSLVDAFCKRAAEVYGGQ
jgi:ribosome-associated toxin RatA of RatAB toxin-antitoxin module